MASSAHIRRERGKAILNVLGLSAMRNILCHLLVISMLYVSVEGAWDMAWESHAHQESAAHQLDFADADASNKASGNPSEDVDANHCGHLCHGHTSAIAVAGFAFAAADLHDYRTLNSTPHSIPSQAPPTPPPNV